MNNFEAFLQDITYNSKYEFLEEGKNDTELQDIAKKRGIKLPAHDLAPFKCTYAFVDRFNKNGCQLPREEVEKSLESLIGKAVDFDHFRKRVVGSWIDAKIDGDKIIAYGTFFKGNFPEDYKLVKDLLEKDVLAVSFEAYGNREYNGANKDVYTLKDIEFAGGALLIKTSPAFPGSEVMEMANKEKVLEFASVMTAPDKFVYGEKEVKDIENSDYHIYDIQGIMKILSEADCLSCKEKGMFDIKNLDFEKNNCKVKCLNCDAEMDVGLTPNCTLKKKGRKIKKLSEVQQAVIEDVEKFIGNYEGEEEDLSIYIEKSLDIEESKKLTYQERKNIDDNMFAVVLNKKGKSGKNLKIRMFPIHELSNVRNTLVKLPQATETLKKLGVSVESAKEKTLKRARSLKMKDLLERYKKGSIEEVLQEIAKVSIQRELSKEEIEKTLKNIDVNNASITEEEVKKVIEEATKKEEKKTEVSEEIKAKDTEIATLKEQITKMTADITSATEKIKVFEEEKAKIEKAEKEAKIKSRKDELAEFAKDMKDEDILDESKYEIAKLKKENAELKLKVGKEDTTKPDLTKGAADKTKDSKAIARDAVTKLAFGEDKEQK